ncbi:MAG TPA: hypothetical protein VM716_10385 [Gemmatimonadales bacterium]|nr:hypothetical protein [Gemmatimonadales bacterium]
MVWLRLVHIVAGVVWVGSAVFMTALLLPAARAAGSDGGRFVAGLMGRTRPVFAIAMLLTVIPGFIMYGRLSAGFNRAWVTSRPGLALATGAVATIAAVLVGALVSAPAGSKMAALRKTLETHGGVPTEAQTAQLRSLQARAERAGQLAALLLVIAAGTMAVARYL